METILGIIIGLSVSLFMDMIKNVTKVMSRIDKAIYREIYRYFFYQDKKTGDSVYRKLIENCNLKMYPILLEKPDTKKDFNAKNKVAREFIKLERKVSVGKDEHLGRYSNLIYEADNANSIISAYQTVGAASAVVIMFSFIVNFYWDYYIEGVERLYISSITGAEIVVFVLLTVVFLFRSLKSPDTEPDCLEKKDLALPVCLFFAICMFGGIGLTALLNVMWYISRGGLLNEALKYYVFFAVITIMTVASAICYMHMSAPIFKKLNAIIVLLNVTKEMKEVY